MKPEIEKKLSELREYADREGEPALHVVLHMLHATYSEGTHKKFARHCCDFSKVKVAMDGMTPTPVSNGTATVQ